MKVFLAAVGAAVTLVAQPTPRVVDPGGPNKAPSDAVVLFDGKDVSAWTKKDGSPAGCIARDGEMHCTTGAGDIMSKMQFKDVQLHLEFFPPLMADQKGQLRGNSGVYLHGKYEIQILDSFNNPTYATGMAGAPVRASPTACECRAAS